MATGSRSLSLADFHFSRGARTHEPRNATTLRPRVPDGIFTATVNLELATSSSNFSALFSLRYSRTESILTRAKPMTLIHTSARHVRAVNDRRSSRRFESDGCLTIFIKSSKFWTSLGRIGSSVPSTLEKKWKLDRVHTLFGIAEKGELKNVNLFCSYLTFAGLAFSVHTALPDKCALIITGKSVTDV